MTGRGDILPFDEDGGEVGMYDPDESHIVTRTSREITVHIEADVTFEVVEPPKIANVEVKSAAKHAVQQALTNMKLGLVTGLRVKASQGDRDGE